MRIYLYRTHLIDCVMIGPGSKMLMSTRKSLEQAKYFVVEADRRVVVLLKNYWRDQRS